MAESPLGLEFDRLKIDVNKRRCRSAERASDSTAESSGQQLDRLRLSGEACSRPSCQCNKARRSPGAASSASSQCWNSRITRRPQERGPLLRRSRLTCLLRRPQLNPTTPESGPQPHTGPRFLKLDPVLLDTCRLRPVDRLRWPDRLRAGPSQPTFEGLAAPSPSSSPPDTFLGPSFSRRRDAASGGGPPPAPEQTCSQQARREEVSINELAGYFENLVHIPKKMSSMAEQMYT
ncbi:uncharacterized protein LOC132205787 [Neocloeon triangulifer]|uniref:uncharacterized protein LOC132205787 n=1 Tax=Neocloeon triangulifer TaxID=2078957 RepID=UPI00286F2841|nr:uncharacterized protein LOC132205787 [Neocloeon triangulifer]XP_059491047.1 uncharacterized protein LOC132205787 [Neocloeon triangulifer]